MVKTIVSCRFPLTPIHWFTLALQVASAWFQLSAVCLRSSQMSFSALHGAWCVAAVWGELLAAVLANMFLGWLSHRGTPIYHPFRMMGSCLMNHPAILVPPYKWKLPCKQYAVRTICGDPENSWYFLSFCALIPRPGIEIKSSRVSPQSRKDRLLQAQVWGEKLWPNCMVGTTTRNPTPPSPLGPGECAL